MGPLSRYMYISVAPVAQAAHLRFPGGPPPVVPPGSPLGDRPGIRGAEARAPPHGPLEFRP
eukprot:7034392-Pyramimonas_sp.AAC.1